jgi:asparagine synthase (glutamine-hydrolysing)
MMHSIELRSPFLDHRLFELAFTQPVERKIRDGIHKWLPRQIAGSLLPKNLAKARKRPVQTPQREWIQYDLREWADTCISDALLHFGGTWLDRKGVMKEWNNYREGNSDNSFYIFQWISLGLLCQVHST